MNAAAAHITWRQRANRIIFFFPFQLLLLHFKKNHFLLVFWVLLFGLTMDWIGAKYGVNHQFLYPEYQGETGIVSFALLGFAYGGFVLAFNLYTYILHGFRFPFIATLSRPFLKFSINNFILPGLYVIVFVMESIDYQINQELLEPGVIAKHLIGFVLGLLAFWLVASVYFAITNKSAHHIKGAAEKDENTLVKSPIHRKYKWRSDKPRSRWHVETYLSHVYRISLARKTNYSKEVLRKVFSQNHINAALFEIVLIITFIVIGSFRENSFFVIPAAASVLLFFTMSLMLISALFSWIKGWTFTVFILLFLAINFSFSGLKFLNVPNHAYGLDYEQEPSSYAPVAQYANPDSIYQADFQHMLGVLDNWRKKHSAETIRTGQKPKLVIINASGGGSRSALWSASSLLVADSALNGELMDHCLLITGSSGGMIGAAYLRELKYRSQLGIAPEPTRAEAYNMGRDLLNPVIFSIATNDFFIRYQKFKEGDNVYTKDRAYSFEKQLHLNTDHVLNRTLGFYAEPEASAQIPMMVMTPTIVNDGRRLVISSQPMSYLTTNVTSSGEVVEPSSEDVEFARLIKDPMNLKFSTALRMNATFPYVLPTVTLPTEPEIDVMDAGLRDNYGMKTTMQFLYTFRNWINTNTSGVVVVQLRDIQKDFQAKSGEPTLVKKFTAPLGSMYGNFTKMQDYNADQMLRYLSTWYDSPIDVVTFSLYQNPKSKISLSWHLTEAEKRKIKSSLASDAFTSSLKELDRLMHPEETGAVEEEFYYPLRGSVGEIAGN